MDPLKETNDHRVIAKTLAANINETARMESSVYIYKGNVPVGIPFIVQSCYRGSLKQRPVIYAEVRAITSHLDNEEKDSIPEFMKISVPKRYECRFVHLINKDKATCPNLAFDRIYLKDEPAFRGHKLITLEFSTPNILNEGSDDNAGLIDWAAKISLSRSDDKERGKRLFENFEEINVKLLETAKRRCTLALASSKGGDCEDVE